MDVRLASPAATAFALSLKPRTAIVAWRRDNTAAAVSAYALSQARAIRRLPPGSLRNLSV